jgi:DNA mismatch repair protein MutH
VSVGPGSGAGPPASEAELLARAKLLSGISVGELAARLGQAVPAELVRAKGLTGRLLELSLGASAGSRPHPDFEALGVELKSLPVNEKGVPCESTFVCTIPLAQIAQTDWEASSVRRKLARVLWMPVQGARSLLLIALGRIEEITGHLGKVLQMRPKAANAQARRGYWDDEGARTETLPRGFYLRASFTRSILAQHFVLPCQRSS